jgi:hypothetical protein
MAEPVKSKLIAPDPRNTKRPKRHATFRAKTRRSSPVRLLPIFLLVVVSASAGQGCAGQGQATRAAEQAAVNSQDDAQCRAKGAPGSPAYVDCRKGLAEKRTQAVVQEQKRRDFDRVLGNGTGGVDETY